MINLKILQPGGTEASEIQQKVALTIVSNEVCNTAYGTIGYSVSDSMICAKSFQGIEKNFKTFSAWNMMPSFDHW